ncbi:MAG: TolC family protein [Flavipsychrobacter sp.]
MKNIFAIAFLSIATPAFAQSTLSISRQDAMNIALKNRYDIQAKRYNAALASNNQTRSKKEWLPDINASGNIHYNTQLQATLIPAGFGGLTEPEMLALGAKDVTILGISLTQPVYRPGIGTDIKIAGNNIALQKEKTVASEIEIKSKVSRAYLNVLLKQLQYSIALKDESRYKEYFSLAEAKYNAGELLLNDYKHTQLDYNNAQVQTAIVLQNENIAYSDLKYELNIPQETNLVLTDTLNAQDTLLSEGNASDRTEVKQLKLQFAADALQLQRAKQYALPTLTLSANYSQQFLSDQFNYNDTKWWAPFSYIAATFSVPITGNIKNHNNIKEYKLRMEQTDLSLKQKIADVGNEISKAKTELANARLNVATTKNNYDLSNTIYETQRAQYNIGDFRYSDLLETERSLSAAEQNYVSATYNYLLAQINYQQAIGKL